MLRSENPPTPDQQLSAALGFVEEIFPEKSAEEFPGHTDAIAVGIAMLQLGHGSLAPGDTVIHPEILCCGEVLRVNSETATVAFIIIHEATEVMSLQELPLGELAKAGDVADAGVLIEKGVIPIEALEILTNPDLYQRFYIKAD